MAKSKLPKKTIEAWLHDAEGPLRRRFLMHGVALAAFVAAIVLATTVGGRESIAVLFASFAMALVARVLPPRAPASRASVVCTKGRVRVAKAGLQNRKLVAKDVVGATTARHGDHFVLSLALRKRESRPLHLELDTLADVKTVCDALAIGHNGFGAVGFTLRARAIDVAESVARVMTAACWSAVALAAVLASHHRIFAFAWAGVFFGSITSMLLWGLRRSPAPQLVMRADGMHVNVGAGYQWQPTPYAAIGSVTTTPAGLALQGSPTIPAKPSSFLRDGLSLAEREILASQLNAASARAHGRNALKDEAPSTLELLRRNGASVGQWLAHIDGVAASVGAGAGYRGSTLDVTDLWQAFEDPDGDPELRTAAGRVLLTVAPEEMKVRVSPVLDTVRDKDIRKRIAVGLEPDATQAERELEALEAEEALRRERMLALKRQAPS